MKHSFRLRCKNDGRWMMESRIDMCINAIEIVHAFMGKNTVRWSEWVSVCCVNMCLSSQNANSCRFFFSFFFHFNNTPSRWDTSILLYRRRYSKPMTVSCFYGILFFFLVLSFFNVTWIASYATMYSYVSMTFRIWRCCSYCWTLGNE